MVSGLEELARVAVLARKIPCERCRNLKDRCKFPVAHEPCIRCKNGGHDCVVSFSIRHSPANRLRPPHSLETATEQNLQSPKGQQHASDASEAVQYLKTIKAQFGSSDPRVYNAFLEIMGNCKDISVDRQRTIQRVTDLFNDYPILLESFHQLFLDGSSFQSKDSMKTTTTSAMFQHSASWLCLIDNVGQLVQDREACRSLFQQPLQDLQQLINVIRTVLLLGELPTTISERTITLLLRISRKLNLSPECLVIRDLQLSSTDPITEGGFGAIWKGNSHSQAVSVKAAKVYQQSNIKLIVQVFSREALLWSRLAHPNVLPFYGMFYMDHAMRRVCLLSPWMENGNVYQYLQAHPEADRDLLSYDTALGLQYLHGNNVVHGDLKGANILITSTGRACIADFGLSTILLDSQAVHWTATPMSTVSQAGSIRWQAPEIFNNAKACKTTDIYALACVFFEIYTRMIPFAELRYDTAVMLAVLRGQRPEIPLYVCQDARGIIEDCWVEQAESRLLIETVCDRLFEHLDDEAELRDLDWDPTTHSSLRALLHGPVDERTLKDALTLVAGYLGSNCTVTAFAEGQPDSASEALGSTTGEDESYSQIMTNTRLSESAQKLPNPHSASADVEPSPLSHSLSLTSNGHGTSCNCCNSRIRGVRYQCAQCPSIPSAYNLCSSCEELSYLVHNPNHVFFKLPRPVRVPLQGNTFLPQIVYKTPAGTIVDEENNISHFTDTQEYLEELVHPAVLCDMCMTIIQGSWFRCAYCEKDLCNACQAVDTHNEEHVFLVFKSSVDLLSFFNFLSRVHDDETKPVIRYPIY